MDQYYITVTAYGHETNGTVSQATDVFSISVMPDVTSAPGTAVPLKDAPTRGVKCEKDVSPVTASIVLDADWGKLGAGRRLESVAKMSQYSRLGLEQFRLLPVGSKSLFDATVLVAGPGNVKRAEHTGVVLSWQIGCGSDAGKSAVVTILESASKDGSMATKLGHNIIGWHVTHDKPTKDSNRVRRQAKLMGTPVPTPLPTDMPPKPTAILVTSVIPSTHVVPTESSPVFSSVMRTSSSVMPTEMMSSETVRRTLSASPTRTKPVDMMTSSAEPPMATVYTTVIEPTPVPTTEVPSRTFTTPPMPSMTAVDVTPSMVASIMPTRTFSPIDETTMVVPTSENITPTPVPPTKKPVITTPVVTPVKPPKPNTAPKLVNPIPRLDATELKFFNYKIPADMFMDTEDGDTRSLRLKVLNVDTGEELAKNSWVQFDKKTQTLQGLPLKPHVGRDSYVIVAKDKQGLVARTVIEITVEAAPPASENPPPVTMGMSLDLDFDEFISNPALQLEIANMIASVFGDADASAITFTNIQRGSVILSWTNNTIPTDGCNAALIEEIMAKLVGPDGEPTQELIDAFFPLEINGVEALKSGPCASPTPPLMTTVETPVKDTATSEDIWISTVLPAVVIAIILLIAGIIIFILYRKNRKGKLSDEDQNTFINKGIPIIFADELEDVEKPPSSSTPLIMRDEKPPLPPPEYSPEPQRTPLLQNINNSRNRPTPEGTNNVPMVDLAGSPPYQPPPPLSPSPPGTRNSRPGNISTYRAPPAYVPP